MNVVFASAIAAMINLTGAPLMTNALGMNAAIIDQSSHWPEPPGRPQELHLPGTQKLELPGPDNQARRPAVRHRRRKPAVSEGFPILPSGVSQGLRMLLPDMLPLTRMARVSDMAPPPGQLMVGDALWAGQPAAAPTQVIPSRDKTWVPERTLPRIQPQVLTTTPWQPATLY